MRSGQLVTVKAADAQGIALPGVRVRAEGDAGGGWLFPPEVITALDGSAQFTWVPGALGAGSVSFRGTLGDSATATRTITRSTNPPAIPLSALNVAMQTAPADALSVDLTPLTDPRGTYYAALVCCGWYTGLQRDGSLYHDQLQFSAWDDLGVQARLVTGSAGLSCVRFGNEGAGLACTLRYPWAVGITYRFEVDATGAPGGGRHLTLHVTNLSTGERSFVATLFQAGAQPMSSLGTFVEQFHHVAPNCLEQPLRAYRISRVRASVGGAWQSITAGSAGRQGNTTTVCDNVDAVTDASGLRIQIGERSMSDSRTAITRVTIPAE